MKTGATRANSANSSHPISNHNLVNYPGPQDPPRPRLTHGQKKLNKILKLGLVLGGLSAITFLISFEAAMILGLGLIISGKIIPDLLKPKS